MKEIINTFVDFALEQKKLQFSPNDLDAVLIKENIVKQENNLLSISNYEILIPYLFGRYQDKYGFQMSDSFEKNIEFIINILQHFDHTENFHNFLIFEKEVWKFIIRKANSNHNESFNTFLEAIDSENIPEYINNFSEAYSSLLPELNLTVDQILANTICLVEITKSDTEYNFNLGLILSGIREKSYSDYDFGIELLKKSIDLEDINDNISSAIVTGLYESKNIVFYNDILNELIEKDLKLNVIFFGLSKISNIQNRDCDIFIQIVEKYIGSYLYKTSVLALVFTILRSNEEKYHAYCFQKFLHEIDNENTAQYILGNLMLVKEYYPQKIEIVIKFIRQPYFSIEKHIRLLNGFLWHVRKICFFKNVVLNITDKKPFKSFIKSFQSYLFTLDKSDLDSFLIDLLTNNTASKRFLGVEIFHFLSDRVPYIFTLNILELSPLSQYKLWMSLTDDFNDPSQRIVPLLPLLDSSSELIRESFICKLEEISEDYGGHVPQALENNLDLQNPFYKNTLERIKIYISEYHKKNTELKNSIKEFNPYNTNYKLIRSFNDSFHKSMGKSINKDLENDSLLSILGGNTIQLAKGGGFRMGADQPISELSTFGSSFTMPRSYFINYNKYEIEKGLYRKKDWSDEDFAQIIKTLENE